ncbi:MAG: TonB-dependent receptor [Opitutales bacterium]
MYALEEALVRAWHFEKEVLDLPVDVLRVDRNAIDRSLASSVPDLLESEANLYFTTMSGFTNVDMRGFGENSGLRTLVLIDGQPLNPGDMGRINWELIPLHAIESIEVLKGGQNVLYGDKALTGVIKIETRRSGAPGLNLEGRAGSFGSSRGALSGNFGDGAWRFRAGATRSRSEGYRENAASETRDAYLSFGYSFANGDDLNLRVSMGESEFTYPGGLIYEDYRSRPRSSDKLGIEGSENSALALTARFDAQRDWGGWEALLGYDYSAVDFAFEPQRFGSNEQDGVYLKPRFKLGQAETVLIGGVDLLYDALSFTSYLDKTRRLVPSEADLHEERLSPYFLLEHELTEQLTLSGGARYEWLRYEVDAASYDRSQLSPVIVTNRGTFPNPNYKNPPDRIDDGTFQKSLRQDGMAAELSLNYRLHQDWSLFAAYDRVYRYPVFDERASYQGFPLAEEVNTSLEAEEGDNFELGLKYMGRRHEVFLTGFLLKMENEIIFDSEVTGSNPAAKGLNINLGPVDRYGGDLLYRYDAGQWGLSLQFAYVATEMKAGPGRGESVPLVPAWVTTSQIWWEPIAGLRLRALHRYLGERFEGSDFRNERAPVAAYQLVDFSVDWRVSPNSRVFVRVDNVFDELYAETAIQGLFYPGNGRAFELGVKLDF